MVIQEREVTERKACVKVSCALYACRRLVKMCWNVKDHGKQCRAKLSRHLYCRPSAASWGIRWAMDLCVLIQRSMVEPFLPGMGRVGGCQLWRLVGAVDRPLVAFCVNTSDQQPSQSLILSSVCSTIRPRSWHYRRELHRCHFVPPRRPPWWLLMRNFWHMAPEKRRGLDSQLGSTDRPLTTLLKTLLIDRRLSGFHE